MSVEIFLLASSSGRVSSEGSVYAIAFFLLFTILGAALAFNIRGAADWFFRIISRIMGGFTGFGSPRMLRIVGGGALFLGLIGLVTESVVIIT
ncbi:hypothetical protein [Streptomyces sp. NPDC058861]|uniref:hypothetical protein n=1 Tax=Streptomyces sp. NPDC058861 TaxID=3346653 RepID=UPI00368EA867